MSRTARATFALLAWLVAAGLSSAAPQGRTGSLETARRATAFVRVIGDVESVVTSDIVPMGDMKPVKRTDVELATGTGFLFSPLGQILTCYHVISDGVRTERVDDLQVQVTVKVRRIEVLFPSASTAEAAVAERYEASVVASNRELDVAVLAISGTNLPNLDLGDSDALDPGDGLDTVGYPFGRDVEIGRVSTETVAAPDVSVSHGDFSAYRNDEQGIRRFLQTSASVNPGNSGGPILDADGFVVGIVSRRLSTRGAAIGFAVPINLIKEFLESNGLDGQLPARRAALGPVQTLDAKGLRLRLPWGLADVSPIRARVDSGGNAEGQPTLRIDRVLSSWDVNRVVEAVVSGAAFERVNSGISTAPRARLVAGRRVASGRMSGMWSDGAPVRMEYPVIDLGTEKIIARYLGPPSQLAPFAKGDAGGFFFSHFKKLIRRVPKNFSKAHGERQSQFDSAFLLS